MRSNVRNILAVAATAAALTGATLAAGTATAAPVDDFDVSALAPAGDDKVTLTFENDRPDGRPMECGYAIMDADAGVPSPENPNGPVVPMLDEFTVIAGGPR